MQEIKFRFELAGRPNKEGLYDIYLTLGDSGTRKKIKTEVTVKNEHFGVFKDVLSTNKKIIHKRVLTPGSWVTKKDKESEYKNSQLQAKLDEFKKAYDTKKSEDKYVTKEVVYNAVAVNYAKKDIVSTWTRYLQELELNEKFGSSECHRVAKGHFVAYLEYIKHPDSIDFRHIDNLFLIGFEKYLFNHMNSKDGDVKPSSVHSIMKRLRRVFTYAQEQKIIDVTVFPFRTYKMPALNKSVKQRLSIEEVQKFEKVPYLDDNPKYHAQKLFMLALRCAGIRIEDSLSLKVSNVQGGRISYNMRKGATKHKLKSILMDAKIQKIVDKYTEGKQPEDFLFPFMQPEYKKLPVMEYKKKIKDRTAYINKLLKQICEDAKITKVSTHMARHSWANIARKKTKDIGAIQQALGHENIKTTIGYIDDLDIESQDEMMNLVAI